eukprot:5516763-Lingulodinium_polyedra.AAC.1
MPCGCFVASSGHHPRNRGSEAPLHRPRFCPALPTSRHASATPRDGTTGASLRGLHHADP